MHHAGTRHSKRVSHNSRLIEGKRSNKRGSINNASKTNRSSKKNSSVTKKMAIHKESSLDEPILSARKHADMMKMLDSQATTVADPPSTAAQPHLSTATLFEDRQPVHGSIMAQGVVQVAGRASNFNAAGFGNR